jgi:hypothetical protein
MQLVFCWIQMPLNSLFSFLSLFKFSRFLKGNFSILGGRKWKILACSVVVGLLTEFQRRQNEDHLAQQICNKLYFKEGPLTKNGPIDFAQSWAIHMKKSN